MKTNSSHFILQRIAFIFIVCILCYTNATAQIVTSTAPPVNAITHCASKLLVDKTDPVKMQAFEQGMYSKVQEHATGRTAGDTAQYTIPVVFHIIHQNGTENIPDGNVWDAVHLLNDAFKGLPPFDPGAGLNTNIDFCVSSSAITRHISPLTDVIMETNDSALKQINPWDPRQYINIWVVSSISSLTMGPSVAGYAMMPASHGSPFDGIVIEAAFVNNDPDAVKVLIHEMGHYLGLYHTFEGGCSNADCQLNGDRVCDTPPDNSTAPVSCPATANTCHSDEDDASANNPFRAVSLGGLGDQPDMIQNYMDYGFQYCQTKFTDGQRTRMRDAIMTARHSLLETPGLCLGCSTPIIASLNLPDTLPAGVPVTLTLNTSTPGLTVLWLYNNTTMLGSSITANVPTQGNISFLVLALNPTSPACNIQFNDTIYFSCPVPVPAIVTTPAGPFSPGESATFSTPDNGYTYTWNIDGVTAGSGASFTHTINPLGQLITVEASNGTCKAVSPPYYIDPGNCADSKENNTWYFGMGGGINFNVTPPQAIQGKIFTEEGCAVLSDANGVPMFHSDGVSVANSQTGFTLLNGTGLTGHTTTTQSALFVPMPGSNRYVYLFTLDFQAGDLSSWGGGLYYSIIDKLGDGGQGAVTTKNQLLAGGPFTEKLTAVKNMEGNGIWVLAHQWHSNAFYAWEVKSSGVAAPVISHIGLVHDIPGYSMAYATGEMKASPSGKKIAVALDGQGMFEVFDFNNGTGVLSNAISLASSLTYYNYGIAFSPNERYLYGASIGSTPLLRFDLQAGTPADIIASAEVVGTAPGSGGSIQLAPDGKIYIARRGNQYLGVISNPNAINVADCGYAADGFKLKDYTSSFYGLPNPVQSAVLSVRPQIIGTTQVCLTGTPQVLNYSFDPTGRATYSWTHTGPNTFTFVSDSTATMTYNTAGIDTLIVKRSAPCGEQLDTLYVTSGFAPAFSLGPDRLVCAGTSVTLDAGAGMYYYNWNNGLHTQTNTLSTAGTVIANVITTAGCALRDTVQITNYTLPALELGNDTSICTSETLTLSAPAGMDSYLWSTGATTNSIVANDSGAYVVSVGKFGCIFKDTIIVRKNVLQNMIPADSVILCIGQSDTYTAASGFDSYSWQLPSGTISNSSSVIFTDPGYYVLTYTNRCGTGTDSIYHYIPRFFAQDTVVSCADTIRMISAIHLQSINGINAEYNSYIRHGDTTDFYRSGTYVAVGYYPDVLSGCILIQEITVLVDTALVRPPLSIDLGPDTSYCEGGVLPLNAGSGFDWYHWSNGSVDSSTTVYGFGEYTVTGHYCGFDYSDAIIITNNNAATVNIGPDVISCLPSSVVIDAGSGYDWYLWSTGATKQQINGTGFGEYSVSAGMNGCVARDTMSIIDCTTAIPEKASDCAQPFYLSPNPGTDVVTLGSRCPGINTIRISISASNGKMIAEQKGDLNTVNVFMNQLMQGLNPAVYIVKIENGNDRYYFKWMIIK